MSLKKTFAAARKKLNPTEKTNKYSIGIGNAKKDGVIGTLSAIITIIVAIKENSIFTKLKIHFSRGKMYLGTYTFFISEPELIIEVIEMFVDSVTNAKKRYPVR